MIGFRKSFEIANIIFEGCRSLLRIEFFVKLEDVKFFSFFKKKWDEKSGYYLCVSIFSNVGDVVLGVCSFEKSIVEFGNDSIIVDFFE